jgi:pyruvate formate lyase activating enzyme
MKEAFFYKKLEDKKVQCELCPNNCQINPGKHGTCRVRKNVDGTLFTENYGKVCSISFDPIEKKPLYHFYPGKSILSIGSVGCNLHCRFCQNWNISQYSVSDSQILKDLHEDEAVLMAQKHPGNIGIAFTYNEPTIWYEYMFDMATAFHQNNMKNVVVSNGYINPYPLERLLPLIDAFNIDLKAYSEDFYKNLTNSALEPVKNTLKAIKKSGKLLEITNLVIPEYNDDKKLFHEMISWIAGELGKDTILHLSRYFPQYKMEAPPTPIQKLKELFDIARYKLPYVYLGNVSGTEGTNTICPKCDKMVISRQGYSVSVSGLNKKGNCIYCGHHIIDFM